VIASTSPNSPSSSRWYYVQSVLTKQPSFWYAGTASGLVGALIAISAFV